MSSSANINGSTGGFGNAGGMDMGDYMKNMQALAAQARAENFATQQLQTKEDCMQKRGEAYMNAASKMQIK